MRCIAFVGTGLQAVDAYNKWAKGKWLAKDVIVHSHALQHQVATHGPEGILILVFFDESVHPEWLGLSEKKAVEKALATM